jgi:hypothetical protein
MRSAAALGPIVLALGLALASCAKPDPSVLATFEGGQVRIADVEARILELPESQRAPAAGQDLAAWHAGLARELAFERMLLAEARRKRVEADPEFAKERTARRKALLASLYLQEHLGQLTAPAPTELRAFYDGHPEAFRRRARREVYTIFKSSAPGADRAALRREMEALRSRVLAGESFMDLAAKHSDSETRHRKGQWGTILAGTVGGDLERVIFALPERTPSQVLSTRDGLHLFWVSVAEPEVQLEFAQARPLAARMVLREKQDAAVHALLDPHKGSDSFVPTREELATLLASGDPRTLILRVGEEQLHADEVSRLVLAASQGGQGRPALDMAQAIVEERYRREVAARLALAQGLDKSPAFTARQAALEERALAEFHLRRQMRAEIEEDALRQYFDDNRERYATPLLVRAEVLSVPLSPSAPRHMAELERARADLDAGRTTLADLGQRLGGEVKDLGWRSLDEMERAAPGITHWALELQRQQHSAPFRTPRMIVVARVLSRRDPGPQSAEAARPRLIEDYLSQHGPALRKDLMDRRLREKRYRPVAPPSPRASQIPS